MTKGREWKGNTGGGFVGQHGLIILLKIFDIWVIYSIMALVVPFYMLLSRKNYRAIYGFFRRRLGYSQWKSFISTYKNHFVFGQVILDRFAVFAGQKDIFEVEITGNEHFQRLASGSKGFIIAGSHVGNFEISGYLLHSEGKTINALVYAGETEVVRSNRAKILRRNNIHLTPVADDMSHLFAIHAALQKGDVASMPCDRSFGSSKSVECDFFNGKADFPVGAFALAAHLDVETLAVFVVKESGKKYRVYVKPVQVDAAPGVELAKREKTELYVRSFAKELEEIVRQYPTQWFNYYEFWKK
ncbi:MAG: lysophospholipid acyltransferase family protein [Prevotellaceae bacterium]|jgi:predicted LPLAT superfamily acyltransferase|nr:lysophospholipid acyltransferase family protein [Prevotellaceae bacterium]